MDTELTEREISPGTVKRLKRLIVAYSRMVRPEHYQHDESMITGMSFFNIPTPAPGE